MLQQTARARTHSSCPHPKQKHLSGSEQLWAALLGSGETTTCQSLGVSFHFSGSLLGISTLHLLCLPEQKEFPWAHQSDSKQKEGVAHLQQSSPGPGGFGPQGCPEAVWIYTCGCVYRNSTEVEGVEPRLCCQGRFCGLCLYQHCFAD